MSAIQFKLTKPDGLTRRITFRDKPTWSTLAFKIESFYEIPVEKIGVSYVDSDGDQVTLSSEEELQDFYKVSHQPGQPIKFVVQDLRSLRDAHQSSPHRPLPETPRLRNRGTFGQDPIIFEVEDDWQRLPGLNGMFMSSPGAFVEVVESDTKSANSPTESEIGANTTIDSDIIQRSTSRDKGKGKAPDTDRLSGGVSSAGSVLASNSPAKYPVHVYDVSHDGRSESNPDEDSARLITPPESPRSTVVPGPDENIPRAVPPASTPELVPEVSNPSINDARETVPDPPLPELEFPPINPTPSLSNDVAILLNSLTQAFSSHPELSDGIRNIVRNATNGIYWSAHRDAITRAADDIRRTALEETGRATEAADELRCTAEEEAGRRVAEALGRVFRVFGGTVPAAEAPSTPAAPPTTNTDGNPPPPPPPSFTRAANNGSYAPPTYSSFDAGRSGPRSSTLPPFPPWMSQTSFLPPCGPPPPPPPPFHGGPNVWSRPSFTQSNTSTSFGTPWQGPPPPPQFRWASKATGPSNENPLQPWDEIPNPWEPPHSKSSPQELRAQVEAAKQKYKTEKERYRQEREARKKRGDKVDVPETSTTQTVVPSEIPPPVPAKPVEEIQTRSVEPIVLVRPPRPQTQVVSNARGNFPRLEMFGVPRRSGTYPGHGHNHNQSQSRRQLPGSLSLETGDRSVQRITRRLSDMGFTAQAYPTLPAKIKTQMPAKAPPTKEDEDNIVTNLLEDLLAMSPKPPAPSGSGARTDGNVPGGWWQ